jgi:drug/metabolite transporter (DMT)-like permease
MRIASIGTALLAVGVVVAGVFDLSFAAAGVILAIAATMGYAGFALVRRILEQQRIGIREVVAALAAYVMIALVFAFAYNAVGLASAEDFFSGGKPEEIGNFAYFSVVTITTLGYGDLTPATNLGRSLVIMETLFGQIFLVVLVAYLVGSLGRDRPTRALD